MSSQADIFIKWLDKQEENLGWTDYELSKKAKISHSVMSRARSGLTPGWKACVAIAGALDVSPITVFRKAGLLPDQQAEDETTFEDWKELLRHLSKRDQEILKQTARSMLAADKKGK